MHWEWHTLALGSHLSLKFRPYSPGTRVAYLDWMHLRISLGRFRVSLLAMLGAIGGMACSGTVQEGVPRDRDINGSGGQVGGGGRSSNGGAPFQCAGGSGPLVSTTTGSGPSGGFVLCASGVVHRPSTSQCWSDLAPDDGPMGPIGIASAECQTNRDCTLAPYGQCVLTAGPGGTNLAIVCQYGCTQDSDCGDAQICLCGDPVGRCVEAQCSSDAACPSGVPCQKTVVEGICGANTTTFRCGPLCKVDADCSETPSYVCKEGSCRSNSICGRPFLVDGTARLAPSAIRGDWTSMLAPDMSDLPADVRRLLAEHYTETGLMEHASIAAFARFSLVLLSLGAPPELVQRLRGSDRRRDPSRASVLRACDGVRRRASRSGSARARVSALRDRDRGSNPDSVSRRLRG